MIRNDLQDDSQTEAICILLHGEKKSRDTYIDKNIVEIPEIFLRYRDGLRDIAQIDTLFEIHNELKRICETDQKAYYGYVMHEIFQNRHQDGYLGESFSGVLRNFFESCPDVFYAYMDCLRRIDNSTFVGFSNSLSFELVNERSKKDLEKLFENHIQKYKYLGTIDSIRAIVLTY